MSPATDHEPGDQRPCRHDHGPRTTSAATDRGDLERDRGDLERDRGDRGTVREP
jgi:hypothetical protein